MLFPAKTTFALRIAFSSRQYISFTEGASLFATWNRVVANLKFATTSTHRRENALCKPPAKLIGGIVGIRRNVGAVETNGAVGLSTFWYRQTRYVAKPTQYGNYRDTAQP